MHTFYVVTNVKEDGDEYPIRSEPMLSFDIAKLVLLESKQLFPDYEYWIMECWKPCGHDMKVKIHKDEIGALN